MNYRFVKKQGPKLASGSESLFSSETNGSLNVQDTEATNRQNDSQTSSASSSVTIIYYNKEGESQNSETTIPYNASQDLGSQDPFQQNDEGQILTLNVFCKTNTLYIKWESDYTVNKILFQTMLQVVQNHQCFVERSKGQIRIVSVTMTQNRPHLHGYQRSRE